MLPSFGNLRMKVTMKRSIRPSFGNLRMKVTMERPIRPSFGILQMKVTMERPIHPSFGILQMKVTMERLVGPLCVTLTVMLERSMHSHHYIVNVFISKVKVYIVLIGGLLS